MTYEIHANWSGTLWWAACRTKTEHTVPLRLIGNAGVQLNELAQWVIRLMISDFPALQLLHRSMDYRQLGLLLLSHSAQEAITYRYIYTHTMASNLRHMYSILKYHKCFSVSIVSLWFDSNCTSCSLEHQYTSIYTLNDEGWRRPRLCVRLAQKYSSGWRWQDYKNYNTLPDFDFTSHLFTWWKPWVQTRHMWQRRVQGTVTLFNWVLCIKTAAGVTSPFRN